MLQLTTTIADVNGTAFVSVAPYPATLVAGLANPIGPRVYLLGCSGVALSPAGARELAAILTASADAAEAAPAKVAA